MTTSKRKNRKNWRARQLKSAYYYWLPNLQEWGAWLPGQDPPRVDATIIITTRAGRIYYRKVKQVIRHSQGPNEPRGFLIRLHPFESNKETIDQVNTDEVPENTNQNGENQLSTTDQDPEALDQPEPSEEQAKA